MKKFIGAACMTAALFLSASAANAATVFKTTFQGATFTLTQNSATSLTFDIAGVNALSGDWAGAPYLGAFSFKGLGPSALKATLTGGSPSVNSILGGLSGNGCMANNNNGFVCFDFANNISTVGKTNLTFELAATSGTFNFAEEGPHLKIFWSDHATKDKGFKHGDLFSQDVPPYVPTSPVPEPATWAMMIAGFGLAGAAIRRRRVALAVA